MSERLKLSEIGGNSKDIFDRDYNNLATRNVMITEVSKRSHGAGIELRLLYRLGLKRILLADRNTISKLAIGLPDTSKFIYKGTKRLKYLLKKELKSIEPQAL